MKNKMFETMKKELPSVNLLSNETELKGDVNIVGDFRFDGKMIGNINCSGTLIIGSTANVDGKIIAKNLEVSGNVKGYIRTSELTIFKETAIFSGNIFTSKLQVDIGAILIVNCDMSTEEEIRDKNKDFFVENKDSEK